MSGDQLAAVSRDVTSLVREVLFTVDPKGHVSWVHDFGEVLLGHEPQALEVKQLRDLDALVYADDKEVFAQSLEKLLAGEEMRTDVRMQHQDGSPVWVRVVIGFVTAADAQDRGMVGVMRSTEALHQALTSLYESRRMETVGNMASGIAHEFNNHLTPISGYLELALDMLGGTHPLADGLQSALDRAQYCADLVAQIQAYGRKSILVHSRVDAKVLIPSTVRLTLSSFPESADRITVQESWDNALPDLWVDQGQFQQALTHLVRNAVEAMPDGGTLTVQALPVEKDLIPKSPAETEGAQGQFVRILVRDTGRGIRAEDQLHIYEPFFTTHGRAAARGMGLPMVQGMAAQHGGWLELKSAEGQGTEVALYLPAARPAKPQAVPQVDPDGTMQVEAAASPGRLLIADDEGFIRRLVKRVFLNEGWEIDEACDYNEVIAAARNKTNTYELVILDLTMPGPSTEEALQHLLAAQPDIRVLFISGYSRDERVDRLMSTIPSDFVGKPFSPKALVSKVDDLLAVSA